MNEYYREYTERHGGFHLFDAIEFKKFGRLDLYASNIISILDELSLCDRHYYLAELMILLLVEHKAGSRRKEFKLELTTPNLKYLEGLNFQSLVEGGH